MNRFYKIAEFNVKDGTKRMKRRDRIPYLKELDKTDQALVVKFLDLFFERYGDIIHYDLESDDWVIFDGEEWVKDDYGEVEVLARVKAATFLAKESGDVEFLQDLQKIEKMLKIDERIKKARKKGDEGK